MCDCLVALNHVSATGATLFAKNSDRPPTEIQIIEWCNSLFADRHPRCTHIEVDVHAERPYDVWLSRPSWCWGAEHGVNRAGVAIGNETIYTTRDPRRAAPALTGLDLVRLGLMWSGTAAAAVSLVCAMLTKYGQGGTAHDPSTGGPKAYWSSFLIADPVSAYVIETSGNDYEIEQVVDVRAISNRTTIPAFDAEHRHPGQPVDTLVNPRWHASQQLLDQRPVSVESLQRHLSSHGQTDSGWDVCMHTDHECTTASLVAELPIGAPPNAWMLTGKPCEQPYRRYTFPDVAHDVRGSQR